MSSDLEKFNNSLQGLDQAAKVVKSATQITSTTSTLANMCQKVQTLDKEAEKVQNTITELPTEVTSTLPKESSQLKDAAREYINSVKWLNTISTSLSDITAKEIQPKLEAVKSKLHNLMKESEVSSQQIIDFDKSLQDFGSATVEFKVKLDEFTKQIEKVSTAANKLLDQAKNVEQKMQDAASSSRNWGTASTVGLLGLGGAGLFAATILTGGAALVVAGAGAAAIGGAAWSGATAYFDWKEFNSLAKKFRAQAENMQTEINQIHHIKQEAVAQTKGTEQMHQGLRTAVNMTQRDIKQQQQIEAQADRIAELEKMVAQMQTK